MDPFTPKAGYGQDISNSIFGTCHIIRLDEHRVLKKGHENLQEPATIQFIAENTTIPVPKIFTTKPSSKQNATDFVMEYIPGEPLDKAWKKLTDDQRVSTCSQLVGYLNQLRELPGKRIEGVNGAAVRIGWYNSLWDGPFDTENGFNDFLAKGADRRPGDNRVLHFPGDNHAIQFAHGDLSPRNVMVDESGHIIAILDWEWAGWFPEYWDVVRMRMDRPLKKQMPQYAELLHDALPNTYDSEFSAMLTLQPSWPVGGVPVHPKPAPN
ncbi:hypothetical protein FQN50_000951 [Emmonsiellopsis sp. PD_5]|nr:hypothetical protein FQN50_000951 [Emmonsiellopsis sp. PD_5]